MQDLLTSAGILKSSKHHLTILKGVTGCLKPGRLTLLLGPPGSGKTTLLKALAGLLRHKNNTEGLQVGWAGPVIMLTVLHQLPVMLRLIARRFVPRCMVIKKGFCNWLVVCDHPSLPPHQLKMCLVLQVRGDTTYNGEGFNNFQVARTSAYISQVDEHQAELTVRETFDFAARCLGVGHKQGEGLCALSVVACSPA